MGFIDFSSLALLTISYVFFMKALDGDNVDDYVFMKGVLCSAVVFEILVLLSKVMP